MLTWAQTNVAYGIIWEIANGEHPIDSQWASDWIDSLDPALRQQLETARQHRNL